MKKVIESIELCVLAMVFLPLVGIHRVAVSLIVFVRNENRCFQEWRVDRRTQRECDAESALFCITWFFDETPEERVKLVAGTMKGRKPRAIIRRFGDLPWGMFAVGHLKLHSTMLQAQKAAEDAGYSVI